MPRTTLLMIALLTAATLGAQDQGGTFSIAEAPSWVHGAPAAEPASVEEADSQSVDYLLVDYQANVGTQERYTHIVMQVRTAQGVQDGSSVMIDFDPSYQKLVLHSLRVLRKGVASSRLTRKAVQVLHREADLESFIIDGALTASVVVQDVRVGDVIDYAYTLRCMNPVFQGRYRDEFSCGWHVPVRREHISVLSPPSRTIRWKANGAAAEPSRSQRDGMTLLEWSFADLKPVAREDRTPSWYVDTPWIDLSEFAGWEDVQSWALALYPRVTVPAALDAMVRQWSSDPAGPEHKVRAALDYVQQNVRYLGVELGAGSYRPRAPGVVCETRFGDCKDQAYLLITLLRRMGFDVSPVLVNTSLRSLVGDLLPSPTCFNHVIVAVMLDGRRVFLDPTQTYQRGAVPERFIPDYGYGLVVTEGGKGLYKFGGPQGISPDVDVHEKFTVGGREEPALLEVRTVTRGAAADYLRELFATRRLEELEKDYLNYYADRYPSIATTGSLSMADSPDDDVFTSIEHYTIPGFWGDADEKGAHAASFHPDVMNGEFPVPRTKVRSTPMEVDYPRHVVQRITIDLPEPWTVKAEDSIVTTAAFSLRSKIDATAKTVSLFYEYRARTAEVSANDMTRYNRDLLRIEDDLGYRLTWGAPGAEPVTDPASPLAPIAIGLSILLFAAGAIGLYRWAARSRRSPRAS